ncbi:hypothetical protein EV214_12553 [Marinisporobacter balticus]|uniref:Uncharacterized protein n=1 Tax=Marinisporobacter balticus TaxID=2018667 RepID=A0A4R2KB44_9FIRM|nr:hypothetical protein EV214_12553 [Marinisporobacter balticus]
MDKKTIEIIKKILVKLENRERKEIIAYKKYA